MYFWGQDLSTGIKIFVLVTLAIFGNGNYQGNMCFTKTPCLFVCLFVRIFWSHWRLLQTLEMLSVFVKGCKGPIISSHSHLAEGDLLGATPTVTWVFCLYSDP